MAKKHLGPAGERTKVAHYLALLDTVQSQDQAQPKQVTVDIDHETAREQKIKNDNAEQDIRLKRLTLHLLFGFLGVETVLIFCFALFQAVHWPGDFGLEEWSFRVLVGTTITQITAMLYTAVNYLFPKTPQK